MPPVSYTLGGLHGILKKEKPSGVCLVTSKNVASRLGWALKEIGIPRSRTIFVPDGEKTKEWDVLERLLKGFSALHLDRASVVVVLGGGTVGDLAGFAASVYLRGIRYVQIPTTLVAQVDSAHGGKTGINFSGCKNQIGSFHPPQAIIMDPRFIRSLPDAQIIDGLGEIIKCGYIKDPSILSLLRRETVSGLSRSPQLSAIIRKTVKVKDYYIGTDFKDADLRQMLNFGHTAGHAVERTYGLSHGYAVLIGMLKELALTESLGMTAASVREGLLALMGRLGIPVGKGYAADLKLMLHDKKVLGKTIMLPVVMKEGRSKLVTIEARLLKRLSRIS